MFTAIMEIFALIAHLLSTSVRVAGPGGVRAVIAESLLLKHQLIVLNRARNRAPRLSAWDRLLFGIGAFWVAPNRLPKSAIGIRPSTLLRFHRTLIQRKRIFEMYAAGSSAKTIAAILNREGIPSPGASWARSSRRRSGWLCSAIAGDPVRGTGILNNASYHGMIVWNRSRWIRSAADSANRRAVANPRSEWIEQRDESLRIVSDELWQRVKDRQRQRAHSIGTRVKAGLSRKAAATGREPRHVFSGWLTCSACGARFTMVNRYHYACASYANGRACGNSIHVRRDLVEDRLLCGVRDTLGRDDVLEEIERRVRKALTARRRVRPAAKRIAELKRQLENLISAIANEGLRSSPSIGRKLAEVEAELEQLESVRSQPTAIPLVADVRTRINAAVARLPQLLEQDPERARTALRDAGLGPRIILRPANDGPYLNAEIDLEIVPLVAVSNGLSESMVAGA